MRLNPDQVQITVHGHLCQPGLRRQVAAGPIRAFFGTGLQRPVDRGADLIVAEAVWPAGAELILKAIEAAFEGLPIVTLTAMRSAVREDSLGCARRRKLWKERRVKSTRFTRRKR